MLLFNAKEVPICSAMYVIESQSAFSRYVSTCMLSRKDVTLVMQKTHELKEFGKKLNITVEGYYSTQGLMPLPHTNQFMCVATPEKVITMK